MDDIAEAQAKVKAETETDVPHACEEWMQGCTGQGLMALGEITACLHDYEEIADDYNTALLRDACVRAYRAGATLHAVAYVARKPESAVLEWLMELNVPLRSMKETVGKWVYPGDPDYPETKANGDKVREHVRDKSALLRLLIRAMAQLTLDVHEDSWSSLISGIRFHFANGETVAYGFGDSLKVDGDKEDGDE